MSGALQSYLDSLPQWKDDEHVRSLFAAFTLSKQQNPELWEARYRFWRDLLLECTKRQLLGGSCLRITDPTALPALLSRNRSTPLGLATVVDQMTREHVVEPRDNGLDSFLARFARLTVLRPVNVAWDYLFPSNEEETHPVLKKEELLFPELIKELADKTLALAEERVKIFRCFSWKDFTSLVEQAYGSKIRDEEDFELIFTHLLKKQKLTVRSSNDSRIIKIDDKLGISEEEVKIMQMKEFHGVLDTQLHELAGRIDSAKKAAVSALGRKDRTLAIHELKRSKAIEQYRNQRLEAFSTLQTILLKIEAAQSDSQLFSAFKLGESVLRKVLAGNAVEEADNTMLSLEELIAEQRELSAALSVPIVVADEAGLENELEDLLVQKRLSEQEIIFPSVPKEEEKQEVTKDFSKLEYA